MYSLILYSFSFKRKYKNLQNGNKIGKLIKTFDYDLIVSTNVLDVYPETAKGTTVYSILASSSLVSYYKIKSVIQPYKA
jgi:hypothetical protein